MPAPYNPTAAQANTLALPNGVQPPALSRPSPGTEGTAPSPRMALKHALVGTNSPTVGVLGAPGPAYPHMAQQLGQVASSLQLVGPHMGQPLLGLGGDLSQSQLAGLGFLQQQQAEVQMLVSDRKGRLCHITRVSGLEHGVRGCS